MLARPIYDIVYLVGRQRALQDLDRRDPDLCDELGNSRMKVRRRVRVRIELDFDSSNDRNPWHVTHSSEIQ